MAGDNWASRAPFTYSPLEDFKEERLEDDYGDPLPEECRVGPLDALDERLIQIVAEVTRTTWIERRLGVLFAALGSVPEKAFLYALIVSSIREFREPGVQVVTCPDHRMAYAWMCLNAYIVCPQHVVGNFRCDFWIEAPCAQNSRVIVEIDGHDFHERTKEQVRRDKARERAIVATGVPVLRFSGSEVYESPEACVDQVQRFLYNAAYRAHR